MNPSALVAVFSHDDDAAGRIRREFSDARNELFRSDVLMINEIRNAVLNEQFENLAAHQIGVFSGITDEYAADRSDLAVLLVDENSQNTTRFAK